MITDLVTPLQRGEAECRARHHDLLEAIRAATTPLSDAYPLAGDRDLIRTLARIVADDAWLAALRRDLEHLATLGADQCREVILLASDRSGPIAGAVFPGRCALALEHGTGDPLRLALAAVAVELTRWRDADAIHTGGGWWGVATSLPLGELLYTAGLGVHAGAALCPALPPHRLLGISAAAYQRLRELETRLGALLRDQLDQRGVGLVLRWLTPGSPNSARRIGDLVIPADAGRYLGWRMTEPRVRRIGVRGALRA